MRSQNEACLSPQTSALRHYRDGLSPQTSARKFSMNTATESQSDQMSGQGKYAVLPLPGSSDRSTSSAQNCPAWQVRDVRRVGPGPSSSRAGQKGRKRGRLETA